MPPSVPSASPAETAAVMLDVVAPLLARGVIIRRPRVVDAVERWDLDRRAVRRVGRLADRHGRGPVRLDVPGRTFAVVLDAADALRVLDDSPDPFSPGTTLKRAALAPFQPHGVLASRPQDRPDRRRFNERVLDSSHDVHDLAADLQAVMVQEAEGVATRALRRDALDWDVLVVGWYRMVRRLVLGDGAADDHALTDDLARLRRSGNWSVVGRPHRGVRRRFLGRLRWHLARAEPGSLAERVAATPAAGHTAPVEQVPQWLFAFDAAAWTCMRTLALIASHRDVRAAVGRELADRGPAGGGTSPLLRACVLDTLRLYPTTPAILRQTTAPTTWPTGTLPAGTTILVHAPFFHRAPRRVADADAFRPSTWLDDAGDLRPIERVASDGAFLPFSAGPAICPGRHLVLLTVATVLGVLQRRLAPAPVTDRLPPGRLPSALSPFSLRLRPQGPGGEAPATPATGRGRPAP